MQNVNITGYELSPQQANLWETNARGIVYGIFSIAGAFTPEVIEKALNDTVDRHEILRTTFRTPASMRTPLQIVHDRLAPGWEVLDWSTLPVAEHATRVEALRQEFAQRSFDLERGPLVRAALAKTGSDGQLLALAVSALCGDADTMVGIVRDVIHFASGAVGELAEDPIQYAVYAEWQNGLQTADDDAGVSGREFWSTAAKIPAPALAQLHGDGTGAAPQFMLEPVALTAAAFKGIGSIASSADVSEPAVLLASWQAVLGRLADRPEFAISVVVNGRHHEDLEGAVGRFARALPVGAEVERSATFADLTLRASSAAEVATGWQDYLPATVEFGEGSIGFCYRNLPAEIRAGGASTTIEAIYDHALPFALALEASQIGESCVVELVYDSRAVAPDLAKRISGYVTRAVEAFVREPRTAIGQPERVDAAERELVINAFNRTDVEFPRNTTIHALFESQAARNPAAVALVAGGRSLTYTELNIEANRLAHDLISFGVKPGDCVGLCTERSAEMVIGLLGILKAGAAYVPLHYDYPKARLAYQLEEARVTAIVTVEHLVPKLPEFAGKIVRLDTDATRIAGQPDTDPATNAGELVYVIYTSGSTGQPKGVGNTHRGLVNYSLAIQQRLGLETATEPLSFATVSSITADLGNTCIFGALTSGGCLHVIEHDVAMDSHRFGQYMAKWNVDVLKITPSHLQALLSVAVSDREVLPKRTLVLGGEALTWDLANRILASNGCSLINHYGPTETTIGSLTYDVRTDDSAAAFSSVVPVGFPIANTRCYVLDADRRPEAIGVAGELYIGGEGVAQGYVGQPELTAERFVADPFSSEAGARMYRTGDRVRRLPSGAIEFLGRVDHQVKIRGFRVELGEVEAALGRVASVRQAAVIARDNSAGEIVLDAFVVPASARGVAADELRAALLEQLPDYMVPSSFQEIETLPLTPSGKVDRQVLAALERTAAAMFSAFVAPRSPLEESLSQMWAEVLRVERVGVLDNFFELGGHSLMVTQVVARVRSSYGVQLPLRTLFESPTVADLAAAVAELQGDDGRDEELDRMLAELESLSEEEAQRLLDAHPQA